MHISYQSFLIMQDPDYRGPIVPHIPASFLNWRYFNENTHLCKHSLAVGQFSNARLVGGREGSNRSKEERRGRGGGGTTGPKKRGGGKKRGRGGGGVLQVQRRGEGAKRGGVLQVQRRGEGAKKKGYYRSKEEGRGGGGGSKGRQRGGTKMVAPSQT